MYRIPVVSSNIASIGYDDKSTTLEIQFLDGSIYQYFDVPKRVYEDMMAANSKGKYLAYHIKGHYRYVRV